MATLILVIISVSVLILVHEWGHFYSARKLGVKVEEFGFGFPPRLFSLVWRGVRYSLNLLPFGGFVKIFGEHGEGDNDKTSFAGRPGWQRILILAAGVLMNFALAWFLFSANSFIGIPQAVEGREAEGIPVSIIAVSPNSPAEQTGLKLGDRILEMRSQETSLRIETEDDVRSFIDAYLGEEITLIIGRGRLGEEIKEIIAKPRINPPPGEGSLGIAMARLTVVRAAWYWAPIEGFVMLGRSTGAIAEGLWTLLSQFLAGEGRNVPVTGPVGIYFYANDVRSLGLSYFLQFIGILSVNLGILNILPIPALDGGRVLFVLIEKIKGTRVSPKLENMVHAVGFAALVLLMILVTYKDIAGIW